MLDEPKVLVPFDRDESLAIKQAAHLAKVSERTLQNWCVAHRIGRRIGGRWHVSKVALAMHLDGDKVALRQYLAGDRAGERVATYFARAGIKPQPPQNPQAASSARVSSSNRVRQ